MQIRGKGKVKSIIGKFFPREPGFAVQPLSAYNHQRVTSDVLPLLG